MEPSSGPAIDALTPEHMRRGEHTLEFLPAVVNTQTLRKSYSDGVLGAGAKWRTDVSESSDRRGDDLSVKAGWEQFEAQQFDPVYIYQGLVAFDLAKLDEVRRKLVNSATLSFDEIPASWTNGEGVPETKAGCVARLRLAAEPWTGRSLAGHWVPSTGFIDDLVLGVHEVDVTANVREQMFNRDDQSLRYGYVFLGTLDDADGDDDTTCSSYIKNIRLTVTYTVLN
jgi:hypothetical protein